MAFVLAPEPPLADWLVELDGWIRRSPEFFNSRPVVLDLTALPMSRADLAGLLAQLQVRKIRIISVEGVDPAWLGNGLAPLQSGSKPTVVAPLEKPATDDAALDTMPAPPKPAGLLLDQPVRSGQTIMYPEGDVTVMGSVASGAEIIAGGSIHIYGGLRGRAIAGCTGNSRARIFCRRFDAELLVIDGLYRTAEAIEDHMHGQPVQAWLQGEAMMLSIIE